MYPSKWTVADLSVSISLELAIYTTEFLCIGNTVSSVLGKSDSWMQLAFGCNPISDE